MAKPPAAPPPMPADTGSDDDEDTGATAGGADDTGADDSDEPGSEDVLLTVCKEADGTYSLIKGDEEDADGADTAGSADAGGADASNKQTFDSVGALLKAILDIINEDKQSEGGEGSSEDQFNAGFSDDASAKPASPMAQKY